MARPVVACMSNDMHTISVQHSVVDILMKVALLRRTIHTGWCCLAFCLSVVTNVELKRRKHKT